MGNQPLDISWRKGSFIFPFANDQLSTLAMFVRGRLWKARSFFLLDVYAQISWLWLCVLMWLFHPAAGVYFVLVTRGNGWRIGLTTSRLFFLLLLLLSLYIKQPLVSWRFGFVVWI